MRRLPASVRISIGLVSVLLLVFAGAHQLGFVPDYSGAVLAARLQACEALAVQAAVATKQGERETVQRLMDRLRRSDPSFLSAAVYDADGSMYTTLGDHARHWSPPGNNGSTPTDIEIPLIINGERAGVLQVAMSPVAASNWTQSPYVRLFAFTAVASFVAFLAYMRWTLHYLDPAAVIPERVKAMLDVMAESVLILDQNGRVVLANDAAAALVGRPASRLLGRIATDLGWTLEFARHEAADESTDHHKTVVTYPWLITLRDRAPVTAAKMKLRLPGDRRATFMINSVPIAGPDGALRGAVVTLDDMTLIEQKNEQLRETLARLRQSRDEIDRKNKELEILATRDPLTGCWNRRSLFEHLEQQWSKFEMQGASFACIMTDIDHFKSINDQHGHGTGDDVLRQVSALLRESVRDTDIVGRYGGEEFCIILPGMDIAEAAKKAEELRRAIEQANCSQLKVTTSVGVSAASCGAQTSGELVEQADQALYVSKRSGRNRVSRFDALPADLPMREEPTSRAAQAPAPAATSSGPPLPFRIVNALISSVLHRDLDTALHCRRVADLCVTAMTGRASDDDVYLLEVAALLHDIGKIGVPDGILFKPAPLTSDEHDVMRRHVDVGVEIISTALPYEPLVDIIRYHHAWYDGSVQGLPAGEAIPLGARFLAIADAYDAMTNDRVYRKARTHADAVAELRLCGGSQFDPAAVEVFVEAMNRRDAATQEILDAPIELSERVADHVQQVVDAWACRDSEALQVAVAALSDDALERHDPRLARLAQQLSASTSTPHACAHARRTIVELLALCRSAEGRSVTRVLALDESNAPEGADAADDLALL